MRLGLLAALIVAASFVAGAPVHADEPLLVDGELTLGLPVTTPQRDWYGPGASLAISVDRPLIPGFSLLGRLRVAGFLDGDAPSVAGVDDPGLGTIGIAAAGARARFFHGADKKRATGLWVDGAFGGGFTGSELRYAFEAGAGFGFAVGERAAIAPTLRYVQVIQPDTEFLSPSDARLLLAGVKVTLFDARGPKRVRERAVDATAAAADRDGDGVLDPNDQCIDIAEDLDGYVDGDGCPEDDADSDLVPDESDACPLIAEDRDGFTDEDGCLDDDNDRDGVLDRDDKCPNDPETVNGEADDDGCPDEGLIVMQDDRIVLEERVLFDSGRARVKTSAAPVLSAIVRLYKQHPEWKRVRIEGHADARGNAQINQELSERRAANVRERLIELGMPPNVIIAEGFGSSRLLTSGTTDEDNRKNRRVEFVVIARYGDEGTETEPPPPPPAPSTEVPANAAPATTTDEAAKDEATEAPAAPVDAAEETAP